MQMPTHIVIVLSCDIMALVIMSILLYALLFENSEKDKKTKYFIFCCVYTILSLLFDIPAWIFENKPGHDVMLYIANSAALLFSIGPIVYISFYELEIIGEENVSSIHTKIITGICVLSGLAVVYGIFTGDTFRIKNGVFEYGSLYAVIPLVSFLMLIYMEILAVVKRKYLGIHNLLAFLSYMIMPLTSVIIETLYPELGLALAATACGALLLYVMLQSGHVSNLNMRGELLKELSYKDMLTELANRRAFDRTMDNLEDDRIVNVIFCDVNGLKYTNDKKGHLAGDELLKHFADVLRRQFSCDSIYRISGDEFVVIIPDLIEESFVRRVKYLKDYMRAENDLAAIGAATGFGKEKNELVSLAEKRMYEHKKESAARHPEYIR